MVPALRKNSEKIQRIHCQGFALEISVLEPLWVNFVVRIFSLLLALDSTNQLRLLWLEDVLRLSEWSSLFKTYMKQLWGGGHWFTSGLVLLPSWSEQLYNGHSGSFSLEPVPFALQKLFCLLQLHFVGLEKAWRSCEGEEGLTRVDTPILSLAGSSALHARILISLHTFYKFWK